jgi:hypothetical protein
MVIHYSHADTDAPVITGEAGSLTAALHACLVTGYGTKDAAGWTRPFVDGDNAVFRNDSVEGSGRYFQVLNDGSVGGAGSLHVAGIRGYAVMTSTTDGTEAFPTVAQRAAPHLIRHGSASGNASPIVWHIIADNRFVHIFMGAGDNWLGTISRATPCSAHAIMGDLVAVSPLDPYAVVCGGQFTLSGIPNWAMSLLLTGPVGPFNQLAHLLRPYTGSEGAQMIRITPDIAAGYTETYVGRTGATRLWATHTGTELLTRLLVGDSAGITPRGYMPGVLTAWGAPPLEWESAIVQVGGVDYKPMPLWYNALANTFIPLIQISGSWR